MANMETPEEAAESLGKLVIRLLWELAKLVLPIVAVAMLAPWAALADSAAPVEADVARDQAQPTAMLKQKAQAAARSSEAPEKLQAEASPKVLQEALNEDQLAENLGHSAVPEAPPLELRLRTLLQLRREGKQAEADRLLAALKQEFPQHDLESELKRLQREAESQDSAR